MKLFFDDEAYDGQLQRSVGKADSGMANVGECLAVAGRITDGDRDSWHDAWSAFADHLERQGRKALDLGSPRQCPRRAAPGDGVLPPGLLLPP